MQVNYSVPDAVKQSFNKTFAGRNKSAVIAALMQAAVEDEKLRRRLNLDLPAATDATLYRRAMQLAIDTGTHGYASLYHAVALDDPERILITADRRYFNAARHFGHVAMRGHDTSP